MVTKPLVHTHALAFKVTFQRKLAYQTWDNSPNVRFFSWGKCIPL